MRLCLFLMSLFYSCVAGAADRTILVFGDSLSAGYGIATAAAWPSLLAKRLANQRSDYNVVNASISGETTAGGRSRFADALRQHRPTVVILALGANDGLRGLPIAQMKDNLTTMVDSARKQGARVLLVGMRLPPNYGPYASDFATAFTEVARNTRAPLVDFLLAGIAATPELFQADMLHPTAAAQPTILDNLWPALQPLLR